MTPEEARLGYSRVQMKARPDMLNGHGSVHGGMIFALADTAFALRSRQRAAAAHDVRCFAAIIVPVAISQR